MVSLVLMSYSLRGDQIATARKPAVKNVAVFYDLADFANLAAIITKHDALAVAIDGVTGAVIESTQLQFFPAAPGGLKGAPVEDHTVQNGGLFNFDLVGSTYTESLFIPAILGDLILADNVGIDTAAPEVAALVAQLSTGGTAPNAINKFGVDYGDLQTALVSVRK